MSSLNPIISQLPSCKRLTSAPTVNVLIEISPEHYQRFVAGCDVESREYSLLKNAVIAGSQKDTQQPIIQILCDKGAAAILLGAATYLCPEAVPNIKAALHVAHVP